MPFEHTEKKPGELIRSADWNAVGTEVVRLGIDKISRAGEESLDGPLTVRGTLSVGAGSAGGGLTVKGDLSVGTQNAGAAVRVLKKQEDGKAATDGALVLGTDSTSSGALRLGYYSTYSWLQGQGQQAIAINPHGGNVGIGTGAAAPAARLHVNGDALLTGYLYFGNRSTLTPDQGGSLELGGDNGTAGTGTPYIDFHFKDKKEDYNVRLINDGEKRLTLVGTLQATGNLGVGVDVPGSRLAVAGGASVGAGYAATAAPGDGLIVQGNVGIGTNKPDARLHVGGDALVTGALSFGSATRQMLNLYGADYGIGVQNSTTYLRTGGNFAFYKGGSHNDGLLNTGGGTALATLTADGMLTAGAFRFGNNSVIKADQGGSIELGGDNDTAGTGIPYIDFHYNGLKQDYNTRIINDANGQLSVWAGVVQLGCYDFKMGHTARRGTPGRALVDNTTTLVINYGADWAGGVLVNGRLQTQSGRVVKTATGKQDLTATSWTDMADMTLSITTTGNPVLVLFKTGGVQTTGGTTLRGQFRMLVAGVQVAYTRHEFHNAGWELRDVSLSWLATPAAGTHEVKVQWAAEGGTLSCCWYGDNRTLIAVEL
jgi:hypothetical protein